MVEKLTRSLILKYAGKEIDSTLRILKLLNPARRRGYLTKREFIEVARWKSDRPLNLYKKNSEERIREITRKVFETKYEKRRVELLDSLEGINVRAASALLFFMFPKEYAVFDIKVFEVLKYFNKISKKRKEKYDFQDFYNYTMITRHLAKEYDVTPRVIDRFLFNFHDEHRTKIRKVIGKRDKGTLY